MEPPPEPGPADALRSPEDDLELQLFGHYDRLSRMIARKIPRPMRAVISSEDILQQTFVGVFQGYSSFRPRDPRAFYRWVVTIAARHRLADAIRAHHAAKRGPGRAVSTLPDNDTVIALVEFLAGPTRSPSRSVAGHEATAAVVAAMAALCEEYRQVIHLRHIEGLPVARAAELMNRSERAVHNLTHRALRELRTLMGQSALFFSEG